MRWITYLFVIFWIIAFAPSCSPGDRAERSSRVPGGNTGPLEPGVPRELAARRARTLGSPEYSVYFTVRHGEKMAGETGILFRLEGAREPLVLDFAGDSVLSVENAAGPVPYTFENEHIVIGPAHLREGSNVIKIRFIPDERPFHRERDHLYTLFVPEKARSAFPCFDQPDLKGVFHLTLKVPKDWTAVSNAAIVGEFVKGEERVLTFERTERISTYLFAFAAGAFRTETGGRFGRRMTMYHLETDSVKVERNTRIIFDLHAGALEWNEDYTGIGYPFGKFDFVCIPAFPYSGMEHPGAIFYRAERLLLEENAAEKERLRRASVIAHETAHMWFGDLVTMAWFDDVWLKEAFAQFMADRIVQPSFPDVNHGLLFLASHRERLDRIERSDGTHAIRQELPNLAEAGSVYGDIIYHKPPVMLNQLEALMGPAELREALREYLETFAFGNATWEQLVEILDRHAAEDLVAWSGAWVLERGRPHITILRPTGGGRIGGGAEGGSFSVARHDPLGRNLVWPQVFDVLVTGPGGIRTVRVGSRVGPAGTEISPDDFILPDSGGGGFGFFELDPVSIGIIERDPPRFDDPLHRAVFVQVLRENLLEGTFTDLDRYFSILLSELEREDVETNAQLLLDYLEEAFWTFLPERARAGEAGRVEGVLLAKLNGDAAPSLKTACLATYRSVVTTDAGTRYLRALWDGSERIEGLVLADRDFSALALELAVRGLPGWREILESQRRRLGRGVLGDRFEFVAPAASADGTERGRFFEGLADAGNRRHEPWVVEALGYLHHPLRGDAADRYITPSLELLEEIRETGDIFFPRDWLAATLARKTSAEAIEAVSRFLAGRPDYPDKLRLLVLQAADAPMRAHRIRYRVLPDASGARHGP